MKSFGNICGCAAFRNFRNSWDAIKSDLKFVRALVGELQGAQHTHEVRYTTFSTIEFTSDKFPTEVNLIRANTSRSYREGSGTGFRRYCK